MSSKGLHEQSPSDLLLVDCFVVVLWCSSAELSEGQPVCAPTPVQVQVSEGQPVCAPTPVQVQVQVQSEDCLCNHFQRPCHAGTHAPSSEELFVLILGSVELMLFYYSWKVFLFACCTFIFVCVTVYCRCAPPPCICARIRMYAR